MNSKTATLTVGRMIYTTIYLLIFPTLLLALSGDWLWIEGWIFSLWFIIMCFSVIAYLYRNDPALLEERYKKSGTGNQKGWDRYVVAGLVIGFTSWIVVMPLDAKRYGWTGDFSIWLKTMGFVALMLSFYLFFHSYAENTFVSPLVRVQKERKQYVVSTGVYGFVRHPMYLGALFLFIGAPLLLGSIVGLIIGSLLVLLLAGRIIGEERLLVEELEGYEEYTRKVKYRLIPYIW